MRPEQPEAALGGGTLSARDSGCCLCRVDSGDQMIGNGDLVLDELDPDGWGTAPALRETSWHPIDEEHPSPDTISLSTLQRSLAALLAQGAGPAHGLRPGDIEVVVAEEERRQRSSAIRAAGPTDHRNHEERKVVRHDSVVVDNFFTGFTDVTWSLERDDR